MSRSPVVVRAAGPADVTTLRELWGEVMRLSEREVREMNGTVRRVREWICPECDYFEEAETEG